jgi:hypothetical protein
MRHYLKEQPRHGDAFYNPSYMGGVNRRMAIQGWPRKIQISVRTYLKNNQAKGLGVCLLSDRVLA